MDRTQAATSPFPYDMEVGELDIVTCHRCECDALFPKIMEKVLRVKDTCTDDVCAPENFAAFRARNKAISADYARIYLSSFGEAKRLKFAAGAAFGSTHVGYGMDLAADTLDSWGSTRTKDHVDLSMPDGTRITEDWRGPTLDFQELISAGATGVGYDETLTGLRRLVYGNLAIYMDLGAVLHFCHMHEQHFGYFKEGKVDEFIECFRKFVAYVKDTHKDDHPVYGPEGSFGSNAGGYLTPGLIGIASNNIENSLSIVDHEQRNILQPFMYTVQGSEVVSDDDVEMLGGSNGDTEFKHFMNALEKVELPFNSYGDSPLYNGIRAQFSADDDPYRLVEPRLIKDTLLHPQPFIYPFEPDVYGKDFTDPNVRTPWFQDVVKHLVEAEKNDFAWPAGEPVFKSDKASYTLPNNKPDLTALLYQDLERIKSWG